MFDKFRLKEVLVEYKKRFVQQQWPNEKYKWEAVQCFQLNWDVNSDDFAQIDYWKALRELCLMRPTLSRKNVEQNSQYQLVYMCAPGEITAYSYEQEGDYNKNINIKFDGILLDFVWLRVKTK